MTRLSGTKEWAQVNHNISLGCAHGCRYCYARYNAVLRDKRISSADWSCERLLPEQVDRYFEPIAGRIMFPTEHDITPALLPASLAALTGMLAAGNHVLVVSKPHPVCIATLCDQLQAYKAQLVYRFSIGALDDRILRYWEPAAPSAGDRLSALRLAKERGFVTSVSMEPCLDWEHVVENVNFLAPFVNDSIWIGPMNHIRLRVQLVTEEDREAVEELERLQTDRETVGRVVSVLRNHPLVRWKESLRAAFPEFGLTAHGIS